MAASKLDEFLSSLASVPPEVARSLALLKILDLKVLQLIQETKNLSVKCKEDLAPTDRQYYLALLQHKQKEAVACSAEKVCIVLQMMDTLRRCISALDQELAEVSKDLNPTRQEAGPAVKEEEGMELNLDLEDVTGRVYCVCQRPSHGLMVACDNPKVKVTQCPYEWFHFECVGLQSQPSGPWFCANCA